MTRSSRPARSKVFSKPAAIASIETVSRPLPRRLKRRPAPTHARDAGARTKQQRLRSYKTPDKAIPEAKRLHHGSPGNPHAKATHHGFAGPPEESKKHRRKNLVD